MGQILCFHKTAHGYSHIQRNQPCEDASASYCDGEGRFYIAAVADGHGQKKSFRSAIGSCVAVDVAVECLKEAAEGILGTPEDSETFYREVLESSRDRVLRIRQLTDTILSRWHSGIQRDYSDNPPSDEELGEFAEYYSDPAKLPEIYGSTLIAALRLPKCLVLLQQGDGRCDVFYGDGSVDQPIPWDERCQGNLSSSLCEESAYDAIRHCVIDLEETPVAACYMGSDGVEDAYREMEGTHIFYKHLSCVLAEKNLEEFDAYLESMLPEFSAWGLYSKSGSLDDVSVAGIVDTEAIAAWTGQYQKEIRRFELEEALVWKDREFKSKINKHSVLEMRCWEEEKKYTDLHKEIEHLEEASRNYTEQRIALEEQIQECQPRLKEAAQDFGRLESYIGCIEKAGKKANQGLSWAYGMSKKAILEAIKSVADEEYARQRARHKMLLDRQKTLETQIKDNEERLAQCQNELREQAEAAAQAKQEYEAYHEKYQQAAKEVEELQKKIEALSQEENESRDDQR